LKWISSKDPQDRIELRRMQGKITKIITEEKNKSWEKACSTVESYLGAKKKHGSMENIEEFKEK
jgi:hypothetical protein